MAIASSAFVLSHWNKLLEDFQMSPLQFYSTIEQALNRRQVPNITVSRVDWKESGVFSAQREYLRVARGKLLFDICGAPFGTGFFVSSWLVREQSIPWPIGLLLLGFAAMFVLFFCMVIFGFFYGLPAFVVVFPLALWVLAEAMKSNEGWDDCIVAIPILGPIYERVFRPETYYKVDTILMFQQSVHNAVLEAVDQVTSAKGVRALSELERKPVLMHFAKAVGS